MSFILDALRRAESERERGGVPGLNAQLVPLVPVEEAPAVARSWPWFAGGMAAAIVIAIGWLVFEQQRAPAEVAAAHVLPAPASATPPPSAVLPAPALTEPAQRTEAAPEPPRAAQRPEPPPAKAHTEPVRKGATAPKPPAEKPSARTESAAAQTAASATQVSKTTATAMAPSLKPTPAAVSSTPTPPKTAAAAAAPAQPAREAASPALLDKPVSSPSSSLAPAATTAAAAPAVAEARIYALNELPEEIRRQLPQLVVGGSMYSSTPSNRMLILNGQVLREADKPTPDLALEQIRLKSAVLRFKGYRFEITY